MPGPDVGILQYYIEVFRKNTKYGKEKISGQGKPK